MTRGAAYLAKGDVDAAVADCSRAIDLSPKLTSAWATRAQARAKKGELQGAIADYERALELDPASSTAPAIRALIEEARTRALNRPDSRSPRLTTAR